MPVIPILNVGATGVIRDRPGHLLSPEAWTDSLNMRFYNGLLFRFLNQAEVLATPLEAPGFVLNVPRVDGDFWLYASLTKAYATSAGAHAEVTRSAGAYTAAEYRDWNGTVLGGIPILNNGADIPQFWSALSLSTLLANLTAWPSNLRAKVVRGFGPFGVALNLTAGGTELPHAVQWSDSADPGSLPSSWDITDATKLAGRRELTDAKGGVIVDGLSLSSQFIIYKNSSTHSMRFVGGQEVMALDKLFDVGLLAARCVALVDQGRKHLMVSEDDVLVHAGGREVSSILESKDRTFLFDDIDTTNFRNAFVFDNPKYREAWFCYPANGSTYPNKALVWSYVANTIMFRDFKGNFADVGKVSEVDGTWDSDNDFWDSDSGAWSVTGPRQLVLASAESSKFFRLDTGYDDTSGILGDGLTRNSYVERTGLAVSGMNGKGEYKVDYTQRRLIKRIWPKLRGSAEINVRIGFQEELDGTVTWQAAKVFSASQKYLDFEAVGRLPAIRFESQSNAPWQLEGYDLELEMLGVL